MTVPAQIMTSFQEKLIVLHSTADDLDLDACLRRARRLVTEIGRKNSAWISQYPERRSDEP